MNKSYDDRIVRMGFDNTKFESNAAKTMATLDKLNEKLKLKGASEGSENVQRSIDSMNFASMERAIMNIERRFSTLGVVGMNVIGQITNSITNSVKQLEAATIGQIKSGGWSRAMNIANAKFQIEGLGFAWEEVENAVSYGVKDTAYGLDAAASAASQLAASGVDFKKTLDTVNGQDLTAMHKSLRAISGVAAMTNSSYEDIARIFTTVAGNGRLMGDQLLQLSSRGMNAAAKLAETLGTTEGEIREMVSRGKIDFQTFAFAMDDAFGDHAKEANKTFTGALGNMKAALSRVGEIFASPIINKTNTLFISLTERIDEFKNKLKSIKVPRTLDEIKKQYDGITLSATAYDEMLTSMEGRTVTFGEHFATMWESGIDAFSTMIKSVDIVWFDKIVEKMDSVTVKITEFFDLIKEIYGESSEEAAESINDATQTLVVSAEEAQAAKDILLKGMYGNGQQRVDALTELFGGGDEGAKHAKNVQAYVDSVIAAEYDYEKASIKVADANEKITESQIDMAHEVKKSRIKAIIDNVTTSFENLWNTAKNLGKAASKIVIAVLNPFRSLLGLDLSSITSSAKSFTEILEDISEKLIISDSTAEKITDTFSTIIDKAKTVVEVIQKAYTKIKQVVGTVMNSGFVTTIKSTISNLMNSIKSAFNGKSLAESIKGVISSIKNTISGLFNFNKKSNAVGAATQQINDVSQAVSGPKGLASIFDKFSKIKLPKVNIEKIKNFIGDIIETFKTLTPKDAARIGFVTYEISSIIKFLSSIRNVSKVANDVSNGIKKASEVPESISGFFDAMKKTVDTSVKAKLAADVRESNAKAIFALAGALTLIAAAIVILAAMDTTKVIAATASMAIIMVLLTLMVSHISDQGAKLAKEMGGMSKFASLLISLSVIIGVMSSAMFGLTIAARILATASTDEITGAVLGITIITGILVIAITDLIKSTSKFDTKQVLSATFGLSIVVNSLTGMILSVAASLFVIKNVKNAEKSLFLLLGFITAIVFVVYKFVEGTDWMNNSVASRALLLASTVVLISEAVLIISKAIKKVSNVENISDYVLAIMGSLIIVFGLVWFMYETLRNNKDEGIKSKILVFSAAILLISSAVSTIAGAMKKVKDVSNISSVALALTGALGSIAIMIGIFTKTSDKYDSSLLSRISSLASGVYMIAQSMTIIASAFKTAGANANLETSAFTMLASMGVVELILISFLKYTDKYDSSLPQRIGVMTSSFLSISISMNIIAHAMKTAGSSEHIISSGLIMIGIITMIGAILAALFLITKNMVVDVLEKKLHALSSAFVSIGIAMLAISAAMAMIGKIQDLGNSMLAIGGMIALITLAIGAFAMMTGKNDKSASSILSLAASFIIIAVALSILANAIAKLSGLQSGLLAAAIGFGIFAGVIIVLAAVAAALPSFAKGLEAVGTVFLYAGAGALLLGAGLYILFKGVGDLATYLPILATGLNAFFTTLEEHKAAAIAVFVVVIILIAAITTSLLILAPVIKKIVDVIGNALKGIGSMLSSGSSKFKSWMEGLSTKGKIGVITLITTLCAAILKAGPTIFDTVGQLLIKLLSYLGSIVGSLALGLLDFVINLINGLSDAIRANSARIAAALWGLVISLLDVVLQIFGQLLYMLVSPFSKDFAESIRDAVTSESESLNEFAIQQRKMAEEMDKSKRDYIESIQSTTVATENATKRGSSAFSKLTDAIKAEAGSQSDELSSLKAEYADLPGYAYDAILKSKASQNKGSSSLFDGFMGDTDIDMPVMSDAMSENGWNPEDMSNLGSDLGQDFSSAEAQGIVEGTDEMYDASDEVMTTGAQQAIIDNKDDTKKAIQENFNDPAKAQIRGSRQGMYEAAEYVVDGAIQAVIDKSEGDNGYSAAMVKLAKAGNNAFEAENRISSPSKLYYKNGEYIVQGLINGIEKNTDNASSTMKSLSDTILMSFGNPIGYLSKITTGELEYDPRIRPVFDSSGIYKGASSINTMLNQQTISVSGLSGKLAADIGTLDKGNADVVTELRGLREDMLTMQDAMENMQIVMDTGALVGSTVGAYDQALGRRQMFRERGN